MPRLTKVEVMSKAVHIPRTLQMEVERWSRMWPGSGQCQVAQHNNRDSLPVPSVDLKKTVPNRRTASIT